MKLNAIAKAIREHDTKLIKGPKILVFGPPKSGKTRMVGTIAKMPEYDKVVWFDNENGIETLVSAVNADGTPLLTEAEMEKIEVIQMDDTKDSPLAAETMLKAFSSKKPVAICSTHGKVECKECKVAKEEFISFSLPSSDHRTAVVIDSLSQLGDSVFNLELLKYDYNHNMKYWGEFYTDMGNLLSMVQTARCTVVAITHEISVEEDKTQKVLEVAPLCGSKPFSRKIGKYFGHVIYKTIELKKYKAISTALWKPTVRAGTRTNVDVNALPDPTMADILTPNTTVVEANKSQVKKPATINR